MSILTYREQSFAVSQRRHASLLEKDKEDDKRNNQHEKEEESDT